MHEKLEQLRLEWESRYPKKAAGGGVSLLGFRYQLLVTLREVISAFLHDPSAPSVLSESVSDITRIPAGKAVVVVQVKRVLRSVSDALQHLWEIHRVNGDRPTPLVEPIEYLIVCSEDRLADSRSAIERWHSSDDSALLAEFRNSVSVRVNFNPESEILELLVNRLGAREPVRLMHAWVGRLMRPGESTVADIWNELTALKHDHVRGQSWPFRLWRAADRPPSTVPQGRVLLGVRPTVEQMKSGYFCERPIYRAKCERVASWIASDPQANDDALRTSVFWIGGRSGCGKSVALLHLLARLHGEGATIVWLGSAAADLPAAIRAVPTVSIDGSPTVIAVDDAYMPRTQGDESAWRDACAALTRLKDEAGAPTPFIVCCGPSEQADQLRRDFADDLLVHLDTLSHALDDREALTQWYTERTGKPAPQTSPGDILLVQLFFEWWAGKPLVEFTKRFQGRMREMDATGTLENFILRVLALNRLYAGYPARARERVLEAACQDSFRNLVKEHHFAVDDAGRPGIWLVHPHLANLIFEALLPAASSHAQRVAIYVAAVTDALKYGESAQEQTAPVWAIARSMSVSDAADLRMGEQEATEVLERVYRAQYAGEATGFPSSHVPAWIVARCGFPKLALSPDPIELALGRIDAAHKDEQGFRLSCHMIFRHWSVLSAEKQREAIPRFVTLFSSTAGWWERPHLVVDALWRTGDDAFIPHFDDVLLEDSSSVQAALLRVVLSTSLGKCHGEIARGAVQWVVRNRRSQQTGSVLGALLRRPDLGVHNMTVVKAALDWLRAWPSAAAAGKVLRKLVESGAAPGLIPDLARIAYDQLTSTPPTTTEKLVLAAVLRPAFLKRAADVRVPSGGFASWAVYLGLVWLGTDVMDPGNLHLAEKLLVSGRLSDEERQRVANHCLRRLDQLPWRHDAHYTLMPLIEHRATLSEDVQHTLEQVLRSWLTECLRRLSQRPSSMADLAAVALALAAHLRDHEISDRAAAIARNLWKLGDQNARKSFNRMVKNLLSVRGWPTPQDASAALEKIGWEQEDASVLQRLMQILLNPQRTHEEAAAVFAEAHAAVGHLIDLGNSEAGYFLPKLLPLAARIGPDELQTVERLVRRFQPERLPIHHRCGFLVDCDEWLKAWADKDVAREVFERLDLDTPWLLDQWARNGVMPRERLARTFDFIENLMQSELIQRTGLFLPALFVITTNGTTASADRSGELVRRFLDAPSVSGAIKARLGRKIKALLDDIGNVSDTAWRRIVALGLQSPWLVHAAELALELPAADLETHLRQVNQFTQQGAVDEAGRLLAPLLSLAARSTDASLLDRGIACSLRLLDDPGLTPEQRDAFLGAIKRLPWTLEDTKDRVFCPLGIHGDEARKRAGRELHRGR